MKSGKMRRVIRVQTSTDSVNDAGTPVLVWTDLATLRAEIIPQSTEEFLGAQGAREESAIVFKTRFLAGVTPSHRVMFKSEPWNIREVTEIGNERGLEIRCTRREEET